MLKSVVIVEIGAPCETGENDFHLEVNSVGILVIAYQHGSPTHLLLAQQADQLGKPWGIIAGKLEYDELPKVGAKREVLEESGQNIPLRDFHYSGFSVVNSRNAEVPRGALYYSTRLDISKFHMLNSELLFDGSTSFDPPNCVNKTEISRLALMPLSKTFDGLLDSNMYREIHTVHAVQILRRMGFVSGRYHFESDPYLFDSPATENSRR